MPTIAIIAALFVCFWIIERLTPLRNAKAKLFSRLMINVLLSGMSFLVAVTLVKPVALKMMDWSASAPFGVIHLFSAPGWLKAIVAFLLMDLAFYYWHVLNHKVPLLWRFHNVHHMDPDLDVSTGFRFHFGEVVFSTAFRIVQVAAIGVPFGVFAAYELVFQANTLFHHGNVRLPIRLERALNKILVTPRMHGIHHSQVHDETDSNYSVVFSWWDRIHRTLGLNVPQQKITIGVPGYSLPSDNSVWNALTFPFNRQRDYWKNPDGKVVERNPADKQGNPHYLAE